MTGKRKGPDTPNCDKRTTQGGIDRAVRTNSAERRKGRLVFYAGGLRHTAVKHTDEAGDHQPSQKARTRSRVVNFWGVGGPMHRPQTRTKRAPTVRPQNLHTPCPEADRRPRSGPITNHQKFVCNTKERAEFFGHASGVRRRAPRRAAHAWQRSERRKLQGRASFGLRDSVERMGAGATVASGRVRLGRKTGD